MYQKKLSIRFVITPSKVNKKGVCPIHCRLTYLGKRKNFSTGQSINTKDWNAKKQTSKNQSVNSHLNILKQDVERAFLSLQLHQISFDVNDIFQEYIGEPVKEKTNVVKYFRDYLIRLNKVINIDLKEATYKKYKYVCDYVESFIKWKFRKNDIPFELLNLQFLEDFDYYLKTERNQKQITVNKQIQRFRKVVKVANAENIISKDPFTLYKAKRVSTKVIYLDDNELKKLENFSFSQPRLRMVKDLFIFCCYTGLPYAEMKNLKAEHIIKNFDGNEWLRITRQKTSKDLSVPLLKKAKEVLKNYQDLVDDEYLLPRISNQKFNSYLKEIADIADIKKRLTHHTARKTFASTVLLYNDVPMEIVSELLGHSSLKITQSHYGKIVQKKVSEEMNKLNDKI